MDSFPPGVLSAETAKNFTSSCGGLIIDGLHHTALPLPFLRGRGEKTQQKKKRKEKSLWVEIRSSLIKGKEKKQRPHRSKRRRQLFSASYQQAMLTHVLGSRTSTLS